MVVWVIYLQLIIDYKCLYKNCPKKGCLTIESDLAKFLFGSHQSYIIKYSVEELNSLK